MGGWPWDDRCGFSELKAGVVEWRGDGGGNSGGGVVHMLWIY